MASIREDDEFAREADDEGLEADDEGAEDDEADDEGAEDDEADDEADDEGDDERTGEADDEAARIFSTSVGASSAQADFFRTRANRERAQARADARKVGAIRGASVTTQARLRESAGTNALHVIGPRGRMYTLNLRERLATGKQADDIRRLINRNGEVSQRADRMNARAIRRLATQQAATTKDLTNKIVASDLALAKRMAANEKANNKALAKLQKGLQKQDVSGLRNARLRSLTDNALLASAMPVYAAFGDRGDVFGTNNLTITGILAALLYGDEVIALLSGKKASTAANVWSYVAPAAMVIAGHFLLKDKDGKDYTTPKTAFDVKTQTIVIPQGTAAGAQITATYSIEGADNRELIDQPVVAGVMGLRPAAAGGAAPTVREVAAEILPGDQLRVTVTVDGAQAGGAGQDGMVDVGYLVDLRGKKKS